MLGLGIFVGLGDMLGGYDRYIYGQIFDDSADIRIYGGTVDAVINQIGGFEEKGYMFYNYLLSFITANRYIFILISSVLIFVSFYYALKNYLKSHLLYGVIMFLGLFFFFTFTYLREVMAVSITLLSLRYVIERKPILFFLVLLVAYSFHHSAIILAMIYFIPLRKWKPNTIIIIAAICFILGIAGASSIGFTAFSAITGGDVRADMYVKEYDVEGYFRFDYIAEAVFFLSCILVHYKRLGNDKRTQVLLNYALVFCFILLLFTRSAQGGRLSWYFLIGVIILISEIVHNGRTEWRMIVLVVSLLLYARIVNEWDYQIRPYKTFLTNGYRKNDLIHEKFEYDNRYDEDKFYRPAILLLSSDDEWLNSKR